MACKIRGLMVTVCPSQFATRRTLFHVLVGCGLLMLKVSRLKLPVIWLLVSMWLNTLTKSQIWTLMPHDLSHLGFLAGQIGRLITISTTPVIAGDSFEMDAVGALRLSPLRRGLAIDSTVDIFTFYVPHRHVYGE